MTIFLHCFQQYHIRIRFLILRWDFSWISFFLWIFVTKFSCIPTLWTWISWALKIWVSCLWSNICGIACGFCLLPNYFEDLYLVVMQILNIEFFFWFFIGKEKEIHKCPNATWILYKDHPRAKEIKNKQSNNS